MVAFEDRLLRERRLRRHKVGAHQLEKQGAEESIVVKNLREDQHQFKTQSLSGSLSEEEAAYKFFSLLIGEHWNKSCCPPHKGRLPDRQHHGRWISFSDGSSGAFTITTRGALPAVISMRHSGRLRSGTTPRAWYWPMTAAKWYEAAQHRVGHIGVHLVRHGDGKLSSATPARVVAVLRV
jgi:hypothetical protein